MTLEEAIKHCEEVAEENEKQAKKCKGKCCIYTDIANCENGAQGLCNQCKFSYDSTTYKLCECASEHRQLAEWLKALKEIWDSGDCNDCLHSRNCTIRPKLGQLVRYNCYQYERRFADAVND